MWAGSIAPPRDPARDESKASDPDNGERDIHWRKHRQRCRLITEQWHRYDQTNGHHQKNPCPHADLARRGRFAEVSVLSHDLGATLPRGLSGFCDIGVWLAA